MAGIGNLKIVTPQKPTAEELANDEAGPKIAAAAYYVHGILGPGLDENIYKECFYEELRHQGVPVKRDVPFAIHFRDKELPQAFYADFLVGEQAVVFVIAEEKSDLHNLQIRSLLKLSGKAEAYIVNFRVADMRAGIMRAVMQKERESDDVKSLN